jgi:VacB/RNase II family 3'-5' exoribonuclease
MDDLKRIAHQAMLDRGLLPDFATAILTQVSAISAPATAADPSVRDLRGLLWASIDNDDSQDLDQLSVAEPLEGGAVKILVAVADVDAVVKIDSPIDEHARTNTTSVYTAAQIFPMLPEKLSTNLTSLADGQERIALVMEMTFDTSGAMTQSDIYRAQVRNRAKLAYNSVAAWLDGKGAMPAPIAAVPGMEQQIRIQDQVAHTLKRIRREHGALTLETIEAHAIFDQGVLSDLRADERNRAKDLIEDFMVAANGVAARFLESRGFPSLRPNRRSSVGKW